MALTAGTSPARPAPRPPLRSVLGLCLLLLCAACSSGAEDAPARHVDMSKRQETAAPTLKPGITYAYLPQYSHTTSYKRHHLLVEYLAAATGLPIRQVFPNTFDEHMKMVAQGDIDISFSNPFAYIKLSAEGARCFARSLEASGNPEFRGQIICRSDNRAIKSLADCRGKRWIAVDPHSAGGYLFALGQFRELGLKPGDFAEIAFAPGPGGKQENVVLAVLAGKYDFGTIREGTLDVLRERVDLDQIRVLARTRAYPGWLFAARKGLNEEVVEKIARAMFALDPDNPEHAAILAAARLKRIIPARDQDFDPVRQLVRTLELQ